MKFLKVDILRSIAVLCLLLVLTLPLCAQFSRANCRKSVAYRANYQRMTAGADAFHSFEIREGTLWAWGYNVSGELGDGTTINRNSPVQVGTDDDWVTISSTHRHSAALKAG